MSPTVRKYDRNSRLSGNCMHASSWSHSSVQRVRKPIMDTVISFIGHSCYDINVTYMQSILFEHPLWSSWSSIVNHSCYVIILTNIQSNVFEHPFKQHIQTIVWSSWSSYISHSCYDIIVTYIALRKLVLYSFRTRHSHNVQDYAMFKKRAHVSHVVTNPSKLDMCCHMVTKPSRQKDKTSTSHLLSRTVIPEDRL